MPQPPEQNTGDILSRTGTTLATAESCTGGRIAHRITAISGASAYFPGGVVTYSNELKNQLLGVPPDLLESHGAVSEAVARAMAEGVRKRLHTTYGLAVTGIAGPTGGTPEKPVGLVFIGLAGPEETRVFRHHFQGSREDIREETAQTALSHLEEFITAS